MNSTQLIGAVHSNWDNYKTRNHVRDDSHELYLAYYNGWLEGRMNMLFDDNYMPIIIDSTMRNIKIIKTNGVFYICKNDIYPDKETKAMIKEIINCKHLKNDNYYQEIQAAADLEEQIDINSKLK